MKRTIIVRRHENYVIKISYSVIKSGTIYRINFNILKNTFPNLTYEYFARYSSFSFQSKYISTDYVNFNYRQSAYEYLSELRNNEIDMSKNGCGYIIYFKKNYIDL